MCIPKPNIVVLPELIKATSVPTRLMKKLKKKDHLEELLIYLGITLNMYLQETGYKDET